MSRSQKGDDLLTLHCQILLQLQLSDVSDSDTHDIHDEDQYEQDNMIDNNVSFLPAEFEEESLMRNTVNCRLKRNNTFTLDVHRRHFVTKLHLVPDLRS